MDPVSALGLAAAVVQFVGFATKVVTILATANDSTVGAAADLTTLQDVSSRLRALSGRLGTTSATISQAVATEISKRDPRALQNRWIRPPTFEDMLLPNDDKWKVMFPTVLDSYISLHALSKGCEKECARLLDILGKVKAHHNPSSLLSAIGVAAKLLLKKGEIESISERIRKCQEALMAEMANLSIIYHEIHRNTLADFTREAKALGVQQSAQLQAIDTALQELLRRNQHQNGSNATSEPSSELLVLERMMSEVALSETEITKELSIVRSLGFETRTVRHNAIPDAHKETFGWVFKPDPDLGDKANLLEWLRHGDRPFWVSGKPGSGKSTFMKYIADHQATASALARWAHPLPIVVASHYFWSSGTDMQKSQAGLLRSLLFEVFRRCPDLIRATCPGRWKNEADRNMPWTLTELRSVLELVSAQTQIPCKFCFFIDGLDEFEGEHIDFCEDLRAMTDSPNIKLCVSSRPWNVFEDAFGQDRRRKLYIHELTKSDIFRYASDRLQQHPRWRCLSLQPGRAEFLINAIADKAQGVFLWVFLVTRLLREGLTNGDTFTDLRRRVESFPRDLEPFFKQIVESVSEFYRERLAETLRIALTSRLPLDALVYSFHDDEDDGFGDFDLESNEDFLIGLPTSEWSAEIAQARIEQVARRLNGRCRGLLELDVLGKVSFLHRTVADFLRTREMSDFLSTNTGPTFSPDLAIITAYTRWMREAGANDPRFHLARSHAATTGSVHQSELSQTLTTALNFAAKAELDTRVQKDAFDAAIDEMGYVSSNIVQRPTSSWSLDYAPEGLVDPVRTFREVVLRLQLIGYLTRKIPTDPTYFFPFNQPALLACLHVPPSSQTTWPTEASRMLRCLLESGHDPNGHTPGTKSTVWASIIMEITPDLEDTQYVMYAVSKGPRLYASMEMNLLPLFLEHGADPNTLLRGKGGTIFQTTSPLDRLIAVAPQIYGAENERAFLRTLDSFISHGAKLLRARSTPAAPPQAYADDFGYQHPCDTFFKRLEAELSKGERKQFFTDVLRRVLPLAEDAGWLMVSHYRALLESLCPFLVSCLREGARELPPRIIANGVRPNACESRKRGLEDANDKAGGGKRVWVDN